MKKFFLIITIVLILAACAPSFQTTQTAIAQTQAANPTSTFTTVPTTETPTERPTETPTITHLPALDLLSLQVNLKEFLVQKSDLPLLANYTPYFSDSPINISNASASQSFGGNGDEYLAETGRMDGWEVNIHYEGDANLAIAPLSIYSNVTLFKSTEGAQLAMTKYSDRYGSEYGFTEAINPPEIGDGNRTFYMRYQEKTNSSEYSLKYIFEFSYRNVLWTLQESGMERNVDPVFIWDIAQRLLTRFQASPLINP
jgi:hypothetical protein